MNEKKTNINPFSTPKGYFDSFEESLRDRLAKESSPIPKQAGFSVPSSYFDDLQSRLTAQLEAEKNVPKVIQLTPIKKFMALAAAIAAVTILVIGINWGNSEELSFTDLANSEIEAYFDDNELDLSSDEIAEVLPVDTYEIIDFVQPQLNEDNLLDYLSENVEDFEELNLENHE